MSLNILVVDDHPDSASALVRLLRHDGHHVSMACSQTDAIIAAARLPRLDLLISDLALPDGNECDLLRLLHELRGGGPRVAVALTGHGEEELEAECKRVGYALFLVKPVVYDQLMASVTELTDRAPARNVDGSSSMPVA
jgi:CheY-like chemotaxis protein